MTTSRKVSMRTLNRAVARARREALFTKKNEWPRRAPLKKAIDRFGAAIANWNDTLDAALRELRYA